MNIYIILQSKPHNPHYLNRYWKFIKSFENQPYVKTITEKHHICPRAKDLFPEYYSFTINPWNKINLTKRQHFIAHWLLCKTYGGSQVFAFWAMCNNQSPSDSRKRGYKVSSRTYEYYKLEFTKKLYESESGEIFKKLLSEKAYIRWADPEFKRKTSKAISCSMQEKLNNDHIYRDIKIKNAKEISNRLDVREKIKNKAIARNSQESYKKMISEKTKLAMNNKAVKDKLQSSWEKRKENPIKCPNCSLSSSNIGNMKRYHFDKCKFKKNLQD